MRNTGKIKYAEFVAMTDEEHKKLVQKYGEEKTARMIEKLDNYKGSVGKKYKSDYRAILNWVASAVENEYRSRPKEVSFSVESAERKPLADFGSMKNSRHKKTAAAN